jgi:ribosomal protein S21
MQMLKNKVITEELFLELKKHSYYAKPSLRKRRKRENASKQRLTDRHNNIKRALKLEQEMWG